MADEQQLIDRAIEDYNRRCKPENGIAPLPANDCYVKGDRVILRNYRNYYNILAQYQIHAGGRLRWLSPEEEEWDAMEQYLCPLCKGGAWIHVVEAIYWALCDECRVGWAVQYGGWSSWVQEPEEVKSRAWAVLKDYVPLGQTDLCKMRIKGFRGAEY
jgi:hypothetical protein